MNSETFKRFILQSNQERFPPKKWGEMVNKEKSEESFSDEEEQSNEKNCEFKASKGKESITPSQIFDKIKEGDMLKLVTCFSVDYGKIYIILDSATTVQRKPIIFTFRPQGEKEYMVNCSFIKNRRNGKFDYLLEVERQDNFLKIVKKIEKKVQETPIKKRGSSDIDVIEKVKISRKREPSPDVEPEDRQKRAKFGSQVIEETMKNMVKEKMLSRVGQNIPVEVYEKLLQEPEYIEKFERKASEKVDEKVEKLARRRLDEFLDL